jgi:hypothetical protein
VRAVLFAVLLAACSGAGHVEYNSGQCRIDGRPAGVTEVEARQAELSERITSRQPLFVIITVAILLLAGASHIEKLMLLFSTRRQQAKGLGERLKLALERYREHPVRYFIIVVTTLSALGLAGGFYVYLDADKRASERALGLLQFCHLSLRNAEAEKVLGEQRKNLESIENTAGSIQRLVDKLPPEEQKKAQEIVGQINDALKHQGHLVSEYVAHTDESTKSVRDQVGKGLASLETQVSPLRALPAAIKDLSDQLGKLDGKLGGNQTAVDKQLAAVKTQLDALAARPEPKCPACVCNAPAAAVGKPLDAGVK